MADEKLYEEYANKIMELARDSIVVRFRFFDAALSKCRFEAVNGLGAYVADGESLKYDPVVLLNDYKNEPAVAFRLILHVLFHSIFLHFYRFDKTEEKYWNIATDIAVENIILNMDIPEGAMLRDTEERIILQRLSKWVPRLTADAIYREFMVGGIAKESEKKYAEIFSFDTPIPRTSIKEEPQLMLSEKDWEKITRRVKAELKSFSKDVKGSEQILMNLNDSTKKHYDYDAILNRFAIMSEEIKVNPDEFDYIYYTYGLKTYKNMPLIEPLEYAEENKIKEFVIAIDTSASVRGKSVESFLNRTYDILSKSISFSEELCVHIIQCDSRVTSDVVIKSRQELKTISDNFTVKGFGATDFRPVFEHVDELMKKGELKHLKGMIYFTDGYGIYPEKMPDYDTLFAFNRDDDNRAPVPAWAMQVVLEDLA